MVEAKIGISNMKMESLNEMNTTNLLTRVELFVPEA